MFYGADTYIDNKPDNDYRALRSFAQGPRTRHYSPGERRNFEKGGIYCK